MNALSLIPDNSPLFLLEEQNSLLGQTDSKIKTWVRAFFTDNTSLRAERPGRIFYDTQSWSPLAHIFFQKDIVASLVPFLDLPAIFHLQATHPQVYQILSKHVSIWKDLAQNRQASDGLWKTENDVCRIAKDALRTKLSQQIKKLHALFPQKDEATLAKKGFYLQNWLQAIYKDLIDKPYLEKKGSLFSFYIDAQGKILHPYLRDEIPAVEPVLYFEVQYDNAYPQVLILKINGHRNFISISNIGGSYLSSIQSRLSWINLYEPLVTKAYVSSLQQVIKAALQKMHPTLENDRRGYFWE